LIVMNVLLVVITNVLIVRLFYLATSSTCYYFGLWPKSALNLFAVSSFDNFGIPFKAWYR